MFFDAQPEEQKREYELALKNLGSLSRLFSDSKSPYLYYRIAERVFCDAFGATDHSRSDTAIDASKDGIGIGLKTFLAGNHHSFQKVAEFNAESANFRKITSSNKLVAEIARLRNLRLSAAKAMHDVTSLVYHCVLRKEGEFIISEEVMDPIDVDNIRDIKSKKNSIHFTDGLHEYSFSITKSTLLKRFVSRPFRSFSVDIMNNPLEEMGVIFGHPPYEPISEPGSIVTPVILESVILPLYSRIGKLHVPRKSGLNQWNAKGRLRKSREVYIQIPIEVLRRHPGFFPPAGVSFELMLPNGKQVSAKRCQAKGKALMSNPNTELGKWILGDVLNTRERTLITLDMLRELGTDSVEISKDDEGRYHIDFKKTDSYENFLEEGDISDQI